MYWRSKNSTKYSKYETLTQFEILEAHIVALALFLAGFKGAGAYHVLRSMFRH